jgi:hypothetical protein
MCNAGHLDWLVIGAVVILIVSAVWMLFNAHRTLKELHKLRDEAQKDREEARSLKNTWKFANMASDAVKRRP